MGKVLAAEHEGLSSDLHYPHKNLSMVMLMAALMRGLGGRDRRIPETA